MEYWDLGAAHIQSLESATTGVMVSLMTTPNRPLVGPNLSTAQYRRPGPFQKAWNERPAIYTHRSAAST
jgi:hypothetical protein